MDSGARFVNPWTVEILNQADGYWTEHCHDAPLTLSEAETREAVLKAEHPDAKFRVVPWLNANQKQFVEKQRPHFSELRAQIDLLQSQLVNTRRDLAEGNRQATKLLEQFRADQHTIREVREQLQGKGEIIQRSNSNE